MNPDRERATRSFPLGSLAAGAVLLALGLWAAQKTLPEWSVPKRPARDSVRAAVGTLEAAGARLGESSLRLRRSSLYPHLYERAFRQLGPNAREYLAERGGFCAWTLSADLSIGKGAPGLASLSFDSKGQIRRLDWRPAGLLLLMKETREDDRKARDALAARLVDLLAGGEKRGAESTVLEAGGNAVNRVWRLAETPGQPGEWVTELVAGGNVIAVGRELASTGASRGAGQGYVGRALTIAGLSGLLVVSVLVTLGVLLFKRRLSFRIAIWLGGLVLATAILSGTALDSMMRNGGVLALLFFSGGLATSAFLVALWAVAESLLRDSVPGFTTSLDALFGGRIGPRSARALLGGLGLGAATAGLRLLLHAFAGTVPATGVFPVAASFNYPFYSFMGNPFTEGGYAAAIFVLFAAALRRLLSKEKADPIAIAGLALAKSAAIPIMPWGASLILFLIEGILLLYAFRRYGLTGLLVTAISACLFRDLPASFVYMPNQILPFVISGVCLAVIAGTGFVGMGRASSVEEGKLDGPDYVRRLEKERRVTYEMGLLSRMQLALLPERPPQVKGLDLAARSRIANEAGGDLYDFIPDAGGFLWIAAGDVAGHGYSCGIQQAMVKASLLSLVKAGRKPSEVLDEIHRVLGMVRKSRLFTSLVLLRLDPASGAGLIANAGHPYPLMILEGKCQEIAIPGLPLGQGPPRSYRDVPFQLEEGASLVLASDGLFEAGNREGAPYGYSRAQAVLETVGLWRRPAEGILEALLADLELHADQTGLADDTTVVVVKRTALAW
ncbi:MAG: hypothetical protein DIJKHBIC_01378 [Thermoanaerobaculia bacterium]|nr:hypothetical protein [Thermoanaerobaculia bacterium]